MGLTCIEARVRAHANDARACYVVAMRMRMFMLRVHELTMASVYAWMHMHMQTCKHLPMPMHMKMRIQMHMLLPLHMKT